MSTFQRYAAAAALTLSIVLLPFAASADDQYDAYMHRLADDMRNAGMQVDAFAQNPFQTGTSLSGYFLGEKTLLLERDAFLQMKANKLQTTDEVADYEHRVKVLRAHGNNILLQLIQAVDQRNQEGFAVEQAQQAIDLDQLVADCKKDADCVADRLAHPETSIRNVFIDNFALATQIFKQVPYMHALEANSIYQLVQLIYLEVFYSENLLSGIEFDIFHKEQKKVEETIRKNPDLSPVERQLHTEMVRNTLDRWKKKILERKVDHAGEFKAKAQALNAANKELYAKVLKVRGDHPEIFANLYTNKSCLSWSNFRKWRWCLNKKHLQKDLAGMAKGEFQFLNEKESKLPREFWDTL